jgi:hypothetical protein
VRYDREGLGWEVSQHTMLPGAAGVMKVKNSCTTFPVQVPYELDQALGSSQLPVLWLLSHWLCACCCCCACAWCYPSCHMAGLVAGSQQ